MKLNTKLGVILTATGILSLLIIGYYIEVNLKQERFETIREGFISQLYQVDFAITEFLAGVEYDVSNLVGNELVQTKNDDDFTNFLQADEETFTYNISPTEQAIIDLFNNYRLTHPYANSVYMGRENGSFVRSHKRARPTQYDPRLRPWYELGKSNPDEVRRTAPYQSVTTADVNLGTVKALVDESGRVYGVVGIDVTLRNLTDYISGVTIGDNGYVLLVDDQGTVLTGVDETMRFQHYEELGWDHFVPLMEGGTPYTTFAEGDTESYLFCHTSPSLGWQICAVIPTQEIDHQVDQFVHQVLVLFASALVILIILAALGVRYFITQPVRRLQKSTDLIMETGDLEHQIEVRSKDEIGQLAISFNAMVESIKGSEQELQQHRDHLEELVQERTVELRHSNEQLRNEIGARRQAEEALQERERFLTLLGDVTRAALEMPDLAGMLQTLADQVGEIFGADNCFLTLWDEGTQTAIPAAAYGHGRESYQSLRVEPREKTVTESALNARQPLAIRDVYDTPHLSPRIAAQFHSHSLLGLPLIANDQKLGAVLLGFDEPHEFTPSEIIRGEQAAGQIALAVAKAQLVETLQEHVTELQARNEELDAFAHTVAHDLKNPVGIIAGYAEMIDQNNPPLLQETQLGFIELIARNARRIDTIIDELLLLSSVRELESLELQPVEMEPIVAEARARLQYLIEEYQAEIVLPDQWPAAMGHRPWIEQVWVNYISNALKYGRRPPYIELGATVQEDGWVRFWVRDNGPGLSPEEQARLFTPFERLHQVRTEGHGLGLSIVQRIVRKLGGQVGVESEGVPGMGSTFYFTLPGLPEGRAR